MEITTDELTRCKRAVVTMAEILKTLTDGKKMPLALSADLLTLTQVLRRLEPSATQPDREIEARAAQLRVRKMPGCPSCDRETTDFHPPHDASPRCESGKHNHCSCDVCF